MFSSFLLVAQTTIEGKVQDKDTGSPLAYAKIELDGGAPQILTNIDGTFQIKIQGNIQDIKISYVGYIPVTTTVSSSTNYLQISLKPSVEQLETVMLAVGPNPADKIIEKAIANREFNDPEKVLEGFAYTSYTKFIIDNESGSINLEADSTSASIETIINEGRAYLSEKVSQHLYIKKEGRKENVIGIETAGFQKPVYNVLAMEVHPLSLYKNKYELFETDYASPLSKSTLANYTYKILDTTKTKRPAYVIYFKPKREKVVAGLEGILYLDMETLAVQKAKAQLLGAIKLEVNHEYQYFPEKGVWFPQKQTTSIRPGSGGKDIAVFGGTISVGALQQKKGFLNKIFSSESISGDLYLTSVTVNYDVNLAYSGAINNPNAAVDVLNQAIEQDSLFWKQNRKVTFSARDVATKKKVERIIKSRNIERKIDIKNAIAGGHYPLGFWDLDLSKIFKFNNYEGIRLGLGGRTNGEFSEKFNLNGYTTYGFKDQVLKYGIGTKIYLNKRNGTNLNLYYTKDIEETGTFDYLKGENSFSILEPRFVNINFFYTYKDYWIGLEHDINPQLKTEFRFGRSDISQTKAYSYLNEGRTFRDYELTKAVFSFLWRPFSSYLSTPEKNILIEKEFPQFTGQIEQSFGSFLDGDFTFTRLGLKVEHEIKRIDQSRTEFILEGNYVAGDYPLTHAFHAYPNNPNRPQIFKRFSVAGRNSFETMYYNEFFSDRQAMLHVRHQLRPFLISNSFKPELVIISRHAIGDMENPEKHQNITFDSLEHGFSEVGLELNKLVGGLGLSTAYRYGAYHLPTFKQNFSLKFTLQLQL